MGQAHGGSDATHGNAQNSGPLHRPLPQPHAPHIDRRDGAHGGAHRGWQSGALGGGLGGGLNGGQTAGHSGDHSVGHSVGHSGALSGDHSDGPSVSHSADPGPGHPGGRGHAGRPGGAAPRTSARAPWRRLAGAALGATAGMAAGAALACPDWSLAQGGVEHSSDQLWVPEVYGLTAGGDHDLSRCPQPGTGYVVAAPDLRLRFTGNAVDRDLFIRVEGDCDTVLLVNDPGAQWHFNDDFGGLDPAIAFPRAAEGSYDIWVGTYGRELCGARLVLETFSPGQAPGPGDIGGDPGDGGVAGSGTGFLVNRGGWALTNAHVVEGCSALEVEGTTVTRVIEDDSADLAAVLLDPAPDAAPLALRTTLARLAEPVHAIGFPLSDILTPTVRATSGSVNALSGFDGGEDLIQISAPVQPGNSGGPVIDATGAVIGVLSATLSEDVYRAAQNVNFAVPAQQAIRFLGAHGIAHDLVPRKDASPATPTAAPAAWEVVETAADATILIRCLD